jgi:hypothetical protein
MSGALSFDEAALLVPREGLSKNEWKRQVKQLVRESKKKAAKGKRDREEDSKQNQLQQPGEKKQKKKKAAEKPERSVRIVLDCSFEHLMTDKEIHRLISFLRRSFLPSLGERKKLEPTSSRFIFGQLSHVVSLSPDCCDVC